LAATNEPMDERNRAIIGSLAEATQLTFRIRRVR
jgi:hypothetical protein